MLRRTFLGGVLASGAVGVSASVGAAAEPPPWAKAPWKQAPTGPFVAPHWGLQKFRDPLPVPAVIQAPRDGRELVITSQVAQKRLHSQLPPTTLWTYNGTFPGPTIVTQRDVTVNVTWKNNLTGTIPLVGAEITGPTNTEALAAARRPGWKDAAGAPLPHHTRTEALTALQPWNVVHVHGAHTNGVNDGWPTNGVGPGSAQRGEYVNSQAAATLWYHDHAMDITRFNVHAGMAGTWVVQDAEDGRLRLPKDAYDIPLMISDCNLDTDRTGAPNGQLLYKLGVLGGVGGALVPFTGPFTMVNGAIWPKLDVGARLYRFRLVNAAMSRIYRLKLVDAADPTISLASAVKIIATDGGLLDTPQPFPEEGLSFAPAERFELLIDFTELKGRRLVLTNFGTTNVEPDIIRFDVNTTSPGPRSVVPPVLSPTYQRLEIGTTVPQDHDEVFVALAPGNTLGNSHTQIWELGEITGHEEHEGATEPGPGRIQVTDPNTGQVRTFLRRASSFHDATTLFFDEGRWTVWHFIHLGGATHPMHIHLAQFQEVQRRRIDLSVWSTPLAGTTAPLTATENLPIVNHQRGWKDTFQVPAGQWISVAGQFIGGTGAYMYHCHLLDHEDAGMMRPFMVRPASVSAFDIHSGGHH